ncbi:YihY/virulence factor BrkB family protein [Halomonas shantousis]
MAKDKGEPAQRGRQADKPKQIPKAGWRDVLLRTKVEMSRDHVSLIAAGVAFYGLLAIFPAIVALISIWGMVFDPQQIEQQIAAVSTFIPQQAADIIQGQAQKVASNAGAGISLAAIGGILFAVYSASKGVNGFIEGLNVIYEEDEARGFFKRLLVTLSLTLGLMIMTIVTLAAIILVPVIAGYLPFGDLVQTLINLARWPLLLLLVMFSIAVLYRFAPHRDAPRWRWVSIGTVTATLLWIAGSIGFSIYVRNFGSYNETYGSLGAVVVLLMWFWLSAFIVLMGAELNSEMERQTEQDTTQGEARPLGQRDAYAADTVGEKP